MSSEFRHFYEFCCVANFIDLKELFDQHASVCCFKGVVEIVSQLLGGLCTINLQKSAPTPNPPQQKAC